MRYMLDTNICIYAIKKKPEEVFRRLQQHDPCNARISCTKVNTKYFSHDLVSFRLYRFNYFP